MQRLRGCILQHRQRDHLRGLLVDLWFLRPLWTALVIGPIANFLFALFFGLAITLPVAIAIEQSIGQRLRRPSAAGRRRRRHHHTRGWTIHRIWCPRATEISLYGGAALITLVGYRSPLRDVEDIHQKLWRHHFADVDKQMVIGVEQIHTVPINVGECEVQRLRRIVRIQCQVNWVKIRIDVEHQCRDGQRLHLAHCIHTLIDTSADAQPEGDLGEENVD